MCCFDIVCYTTCDHSSLCKGNKLGHCKHWDLFLENHGCSIPGNAAKQLAQNLVFSQQQRLGFWDRGFCFFNVQLLPIMYLPPPITNSCSGKKLNQRQLNWLNSYENLSFAVMQCNDSNLPKNYFFLLHTYYYFSTYYMLCKKWMEPPFRRGSNRNPTQAIVVSGWVPFENFSILGISP